jgi:hypothetical protein
MSVRSENKRYHKVRPERIPEGSVFRNVLLIIHLFPKQIAITTIAFPDTKINNISGGSTLAGAVVVLE